MPDDDNQVNDIVKASEGVAALVKAAGDSEAGKRAASNIGAAAVTLTSAVNNVLLPLAAVNFAFDKARRYFNERFTDDLSEKLGDLPQEGCQSPDPAFASQALQGLALSHEDDALRSMYLSLLAASLDPAKTTSAHPAFINVLRQVTPFEAQLMGQILSEPTTPLARVVLLNYDFKENEEPTQLVSVRKHLMEITDTETGLYSDDDRIELMIDNFCRLGLTSVSYGNVKGSGEQFTWALEHPWFLDMYNRGENGILMSKDGKHRFRVGIQYGLLRMTVFGQQFAVSIGAATSTVFADEA